MPFTALTSLTCRAGEVVIGYILTEYKAAEDDADADEAEYCATEHVEGE